MSAGFDILFEDETALVVSKPGGLLTQAPLGIDDKTAAPAGAVVQIKTTDSRGRSRMFHGRP